MSRISSIAQGPYGIEEAIEQAGGHGLYQKKMLTILCGSFWIASAYIMGMGFYLAPPILICSDGSTCSQTEACGHSYTLSPKSVRSMAYEWSLICDQQYVTTVIGICYFIGTILGSSPMSWICSRVGRKKCTIMSLAATCLILLGGSFAPNPEIIYGVSFCSGLTMAGFGIGTFLLLDEMVDTEHRNLYTGILFSFWSVGTCSNAILFYLINDWRYVMFIFAVGALLNIPFVCMLFESVRWVIVTKKNIPEANLILQRIAHYNGIPNPKVEVHHAIEGPSESGNSDDIDEKLLQQLDEDAHFADLFKYHKTRVRLLACASMYFANNLCYYGIVFSLSSYIGNIYLNGAFLGLGEIVPSIVTGAMLNHIPRKSGNLVSGLLGAALSAAAYLCIVWSPCDSSQNSCFIANASTAALLFLSMYMFASSFMVLAIFITELFPTRYRSMALGVCNTCAKCGGLLSATLMVVRQYGGIHPLIIIAGTSFVSAFMAVFLPETKGKELEDY